MILISRRRLFTTMAVGVAAIGSLFAGDAQAAKASKQQANYRDSPRNDHRCGKCRYFEEPHSCKLVAGEISPDGWCKFFMGKG